MMSMHKRSGAALITVMVVVFIVMAIIANLSVTDFRVIKRLSNRQQIEQASQLRCRYLCRPRVRRSTAMQVRSI
mgnify:CR=1 FL=1